MTKTADKPALSEVQKERLRALAQHTVRCLADLQYAEIEGLHARIAPLVKVYTRADASYHRALNTAAFADGDSVVVLVEGQYKDRVVPVMEVSSREIVLSIDGSSVVARPSDIRMATQEEIDGSSAPSGR